jgi:circadian clock protein KaiC
MAHSNQIREFLLTPDGIELRDVYLGAEGVLTGSARAAQEAREREADSARRLEVESRARALEVRRRAVEAQIAELQAELEAHEEEARRATRRNEVQQETLDSVRAEMASIRKADAERPSPAAKLHEKGARR